MAELIYMPKMSDTMTEGILSKWLKKVGDSVSEGDILAEVETDKAVMELESYEQGVLLHVGAKEGEAVPVDGVIAVVGKEGEDIQELLNAASIPERQKSATDSVEEKKPPEEKVQTPESPKSPQPAISTDRLRSSPLARRLAAEKNLPIEQLSGTGPQGRIIKRDVESYEKEGKAKEKVLGGYEEVVFSQMRKTIAQRLSESKFSAPHFYLSLRIRADNLVRTRTDLNEISSVRISYNDYILKAVAKALRKHPYVNATLHGDRIRLHKGVHLGVAIAIPEGLVVPVLRSADQKSLSEISTEVKAWAERAKERNISPEDMQGSTFSVSNLGMYGIESFTAIINPPNVAILAVGGLEQSFIPDEQGNPILSHAIRVTLSCDHRIVDGAVGSAFLNSLRDYIENPSAMLL
ncbi:MAG: dihydrolipoamide acetyltransferase family protein [Cytophagales bacterium]|nr:dihydrolipoamide acetyltransferase family protein [Cytophagales bacterium]